LAKLNIYSGASGVGTADSGYDDLVVENSSTVGMSILGPDGNGQGLAFGSPSNTTVAEISTHYNSGNEFMHFDAGGTEVMRLLDTGNVGIGTTSPAAKLHVYDNDSNTTGASGAHLWLRNFNETDGATSAIIFGNAEGSGSQNMKGAIFFEDVGITSGRGDMVFAVNNTGGDGNVLLADYDMKITNDGDVCGPDADLSNCASDIRLKENIEPYAIGLEEILQLNPVEFNWNTIAGELGFNTEIRSLGLIAQEVEEVIPEWVSTNSDGYKKVDGDGNLRYALVNAIQELNTKVDEKDAEINELKQRISALENK